MTRIMMLMSALHARGNNTHVTLSQNLRTLKPYYFVSARVIKELENFVLGIN